MIDRYTLIYKKSINGKNTLKIRAETTKAT